MGGLMELGPMTEDISVMGKMLTIRPLSVEQIIYLVGEFPVLMDLLGESDDPEKKKQDPSVVGVIALAHVIATATGEGKSPEAVEVARMLGIGKVAEIVERIMDITFEDGTGPFMKRIKKATRNLASADSSTESSVPWSASLTGDAPRRTRLPLRHAS